MKKYIISIISLILGLGCFITFELLGSSVKADGTLVEPFYLIPVGFILVAISLISLIIALLIKNKSKKFR